MKEFLLRTLHHEFMHDPYVELFEYIRKQGSLSSFFVCGDVTRNIETMCETNSDSISIDENVDLLTGVKQLYAKAGANPRDQAEDTACSRGYSGSSVVGLLQDAEYTLA